MPNARYRVSPHPDNCLPAQTGRYLIESWSRMLKSDLSPEESRGQDDKHWKKNSDSSVLVSTLACYCLILLNELRVTRSKSMSPEMKKNLPVISGPSDQVIRAGLSGHFAQNDLSCHIVRRYLVETRSMMFKSNISPEESRGRYDMRSPTKNKYSPTFSLQLPIFY